MCYRGVAFKKILRFFEIEVLRRNLVFAVRLFAVVSSWSLLGCVLVHCVMIFASYSSSSFLSQWLWWCMFPSPSISAMQQAEFCKVLFLS